jgi:hypothetical protein
MNGAVAARGAGSHRMSWNMGNSEWAEPLF